MSARDDLKLMVDYEDAADAYRAEKAKRGKPSFDQKAYEKAKKKATEMRTYWRQIREAVAAGIDAKGNPVATGEGEVEFVDVED